MSDSFVFVCRRNRAKACSSCGKLGSFLCDYPVTRHGKAGTCDKPICGRCRVVIREGVDYCGVHARLLVNKEHSDTEIGRRHGDG